MTETHRTPHIPGSDPATAAIVAFLKDCDRREVVYREVNVVARCDVQKKGRGYLRSARNRLLRDHGQLWDCVRGVGLCRLVDDEKIMFMEHKRRHIGRTANGIRLVGGKVSVKDLSAPKQKEFFAIIAATGTISLFAKPSAVQKMVASGIMKQPDLRKLLSSFPK